MGSISRILCLLLLSFTTFGQSEEEISIYQNGIENNLWHLLKDKPINSLRILQNGEANNIHTSGLETLKAKQFGQENQIVFDQKKSSIEQITVNQYGSFNEVISIGENSILDGAKIIQQGDFKTLLIKNE